MTDIPKKHRVEELTTCEARIAAWADWFQVEQPPLEYEDGSLLLTDALYRWFERSNASFDWIFCGDPAGMAHAFRDAIAAKKGIAPDAPEQSRSGQNRLI